eukprot:942447-Pelagomonas_calceolata.AAC.3
MDRNEDEVWTWRGAYTRSRKAAACGSCCLFYPLLPQALLVYTMAVTTEFRDKHAGISKQLHDHRPCMQQLRRPILLGGLHGVNNHAQAKDARSNGITKHRLHKGNAVGSLGQAGQASYPFQNAPAYFLSDSNEMKEPPIRPFGQYLFANEARVGTCLQMKQGAGLNQRAALPEYLQIHSGNASHDGINEPQAMMALKSHEPWWRFRAKS